MDLRTGKTYETVDAARADGVPDSDIAHIEFLDRLRDAIPVVKFTKGSFKKFARDEDGKLVPV